MCNRSIANNVLLPGMDMQRSSGASAWWLQSMSIAFFTSITMNKKLYAQKGIPLLLFLLISQVLMAQQRYTVSGTIRDKASGETMIGVTVHVAGVATMGTSCNEYGFYSLTLNEGKHRMVFDFIGYQPDTLAVELKANVKLDHWMQEEALQAKEVVITAEGKNDNIVKPEVGIERLDVKEISKLPVIFGEKDILKTMQLLPGIKSGGDGGGGFFVRGGSTDQNLILLDEAPVYNASHLLGFFSTFNSDALKDVSIMKGISPANFGGRLSSVVDVKMRDGSNQKFGATGGIGLISSRLSIDGPLVKNKGSFIVSGRRTYADVFLRASDRFRGNRLYFYDLNLKANYELNDRNRIYLSGYFGRDVLGVGSIFGIDWGNKTGTLRWNHVFNPRLFSNTSVIYSDYSYNIDLKAGNTNFNLDSRIQDWNLKQEFSFFQSTRSTWKFGLNSIHHTIMPSRFTGDGLVVPQVPNRNGWENAVYVNNTLKTGSRFNLDYGIRFSSYTILGGDTYRTYVRSELRDSVRLASGELGKTYYFIEPRVQFSWVLSESSSLKGGYARNTQNMHLLSNSSAGTPTDQWIGSSYSVKPEVADQVSLGWFKNLRNDRYQLSIESYYKYMQNQIDFKDGADLQTTDDVESQLLSGIGRAYGVEFLVKKTQGRFTGWVGYTLSRTERKIDGINGGDWYNARQDRTHDMSVVAMYQLSEKWSASGVFVYFTGNAVTFPTGKYSIDGNNTFLYSSRNADRMPAYHRLDLSATYTPSQKNRFESSWNFSIFNVYGRENAYSIAFETSESNPQRTVARQTALFRWVPSITYNFKF